MTTSFSYQHAEVNSAGDDLATDTSIDINNNNNKSSNINNRIIRSMMAIGIAFLMAIANGSFSTSNYDANTASQGMMLRPKRVPLASLSSKNDDDYHDYKIDGQDAYDNAPKPDYNGEGKYDWQKCQDSSDPDCWKNEGERVGSYWDNFGQRIGAYWTSFRDAIKSFFTFGSKVTEPPPLPEPPTPVTVVEEKETTPVLEEEEDDATPATVVEEKETTPVLEEDEDDATPATVVEEKETTPVLEEDEDDATPATAVEEKETTPALEEDEDDAVVDADSTAV